VFSLLISEESYKIWEQCYNLYDYEIICQLLLMLVNISLNSDYDFKINLMLSDFLQKTFIDLFLEKNDIQKNRYFHFIIHLQFEHTFCICY